MTALRESLYESTHKVMAEVLDAEPRITLGRKYLPRSIEVKWKRVTGHGWTCGWISLYGPQIRKDGTVGAREVHESIWTMADGTVKPTAAWSSALPVPDWAVEFCRSSRPTWAAAS